HVEQIAKMRNYIKLPSDICLSSQSIDVLIISVYPNISLHAGDPNYLMHHGILASKNMDVQFINLTVMNIYLGDKVKYL
ncbi:28896_t:CDS:1, partial [Racocetra persica]